MTKASVIPGLSSIFVGIVIIAVSIPLLKDNIKMNSWYGIRFKKSFESTENRYKINRYGSHRLILWSLILVAIGILTLFVPLGEKGAVLYAICVPLIYVIPVIEIWLFAKKL